VDTFGELYSSVLETNIVPLSVIEIEGESIPISGVDLSPPDEPPLGPSRPTGKGGVQSYQSVLLTENRGIPRDGIKDWILFSSLKTVATKLVKVI